MGYILNYSSGNWNNAMLVLSKHPETIPFRVFLPLIQRTELSGLMSMNARIRIRVFVDGRSYNKRDWFQVTSIWGAWVQNGLEQVKINWHEDKISINIITYVSLHIKHITITYFSLFVFYPVSKTFTY